MARRTQADRLAEALDQARAPEDRGGEIAGGTGHEPATPSLSNDTSDPLEAQETGPSGQSTEVLGRGLVRARQGGLPRAESPPDPLVLATALLQYALHSDRPRALVEAAQVLLEAVRVRLDLAAEGGKGSS